MSGLRRVKSGVFSVENAVPYEWFLREDITPAQLEEKIIPTDSVLPFPALEVSEKEREKLLFGQTVVTDYADGIYKFYNADGSFYGLAEAKNKRVKLVTKLC